MYSHTGNSIYSVSRKKRKMKTFVAPILSVFVLLSGVSGVKHGGDQANDTSPDISNEKCPLQLNTKLPGMNCSVPNDYFCGQITCSALFSHVDIKLTMKITQVDDWPSRRISAYISLSFPDRLTWSHSFSDGETFKVPGFPLKVEGFEGADVFLQVSLKKENRTIYFKVDLHASNPTTEETYSTTIFAGKTPDDAIPTMVVCRFSPFGGVKHGGDQANDTSPDISNEKCPLQLNTKLPGMNCSVPNDYFCGQITCSALFSHVDIKLTMKITQVDDWPSRRISAYISLSFPDRLTWSHSFSDGEKFKVPGFPLKVEGFEGADVFLQVSLKKEKRTIYFKVDLHASNPTTEETYSTTIFAGKKPDDAIPTTVVCRFGPFGDKSDFSKDPTTMAVFALVFFLIVIATFYCLCEKKKVTAGQVKPSKPPSYEEATSIKTTVPLQPLINEV